MDQKTRSLFKERANIIKALAHPSRLLIVDRLARGDSCVKELAEIVEADVSTVSRHLSVLKGSGIVNSRKESQKVYYSLKVPCVLNFFSCVESVMESSVNERAELLK